jgi:hypothetical protein
MDDDRGLSRATDDEVAHRDDLRSRNTDGAPKAEVEGQMPESNDNPVDQ